MIRPYLGLQGQPFDPETANAAGSPAVDSQLDRLLPQFDLRFSAMVVNWCFMTSPMLASATGWRLGFLFQIGRRFGTLQKRLVAILAYEKASSYPAAQIVLDGLG